VTECVFLDLLDAGSVAEPRSVRQMQVSAGVDDDGALLVRAAGRADRNDADVVF